MELKEINLLKKVEKEDYINRNLLDDFYIISKKIIFQEILPEIKILQEELSKATESLKHLNSKLRKIYEMEDIDWIKKYGKDFKNQDDILSDMTEEEVKHLIKDYWKLIHDIIKEKN